MCAESGRSLLTAGVLFRQRGGDVGEVVVLKMEHRVIKHQFNVSQDPSLRL